VGADRRQWDAVIGVNLTGVYNTIAATAPGMIAAGRGSIIITSSTCGVSGFVGQTPGGFGYTASKHGVIGLMRAYAIELGKHGIRVNAVLPSSVATGMGGDNSADFMQAALDAGQPRPVHVLPIGRLEPGDISDAVVWLASDQSRAVTGVALPVDAGALVT
jgi:NAD(P)-dependent dehydrogenase (short-subunit alcohol dehydrogenase family)